MSKILLVEDDNNLREIYDARLQAEGYDIVSAKDGEEALVLSKSEKPNLIISDVMMPKISGFEMLDIIRNTPELAETPVIMLTALGQSEDQGRADRLGADRYLVKSQVTLEDIVRVAHELLNDTPQTNNTSDEPNYDAENVAPNPVVPQDQTYNIPTSNQNIVEPSVEPSMEPNMEPSMEPSMEPNMEPKDPFNQLSFSQANNTTDQIAEAPLDTPTNQTTAYTQPNIPSLNQNDQTSDISISQSGQLTQSENSFTETNQKLDNQTSNDQLLNQAVNELTNPQANLTEPTFQTPTTPQSTTTINEPPSTNAQQVMINGKKIIQPLNNNSVPTTSTLEELIAREEQNQNPNNSLAEKPVVPNDNLFEPSDPNNIAI